MAKKAKKRSTERARRKSPPRDKEAQGRHVEEPPLRQVKSRKQAIAIGLSEARKRGAKVPKKKRG